MLYPIAQDFYQLSNSSIKTSFSVPIISRHPKKKKKNFRPTKLNHMPISKPVTLACAFTQSWIKLPPRSWGRGFSSVGGEKWGGRPTQDTWVLFPKSCTIHSPLTLQPCPKYFVALICIIYSFLMASWIPLLPLRYN